MRHFIGGFLLSLVLLAFTVGPTCVYAKVQVGEEVKERYETYHPYNATEGIEKTRLPPFFLPNP